MANHIWFLWLYVCFYSELNCSCTDCYRRTLTCHSWFWPVIVVIYFQVCGKCGEGGANVCCIQRGCEWRLHYGCARQQGWELDEEAYIARCAQHKVSYWRVKVSCCIVFCIRIGKVFQRAESGHVYGCTLLYGWVIKHILSSAVAYQNGGLKGSYWQSSDSYCKFFHDTLQHFFTFVCYELERISNVEVQNFNKWSKTDMLLIHTSGWVSRILNGDVNDGGSVLFPYTVKSLYCEYLHSEHTQSFCSIWSLLNTAWWDCDLTLSCNTINRYCFLWMALYSGFTLFRSA